MHPRHPRGPRLAAWSFLSLLIALTVPVSAHAQQSPPPPFFTNLLVNPDAETGDMTGWTLTANGGSGWVATGDPGFRVFRTSYVWNSREQVVDLWSRGFTPEMMAESPLILVSEEFRGTWCPDTYGLRVELLDADMQVVTFWDTGVRTTPGPCVSGLGPAETLAYTFRDYGAGVRYVRWSDGGKDSEYWGGHYGTVMDNASLTVADHNHPAYYTNLLLNPDAEAGDLSGWQIDENGGEGWIATEPAGSRVFRTSYAWDRRHQLVDLWQHGFDPEVMAGQPLIHVGERFHQVYCSDNYSLKVQLLDASMAVVASWDSGVRQTGHPCDWNIEAWETLSHVFADYGPGVRYVRFEDGGKDGESWGGHYGTILDDAMVHVLDRNLLTNPGSQTGDFSGWDVYLPETEHVLAVERDGIAGNLGFQTAHPSSRRTQVVDLLAKGYSAAMLDAAPAIHASELFRRQYCPDPYFLKVELLDANQAVLAAWDSGTKTNTGACQWGGETWDLLGHSFTDYGPGVRYVRWTDGGGDSENWGGDYGVVLDGAYLALQDLRDTAAHRASERQVREDPDCGGADQLACKREEMVPSDICGFFTDYYSCVPKKVTRRWCKPGNLLDGIYCRAKPIDCCTPFDFVDENQTGGNPWGAHLTAGYFARVGVESVDVVLPLRSTQGECGWGDNASNYNEYRSLIPNPADLWLPNPESWSEVFPDVQLMVNANFFDISQPLYGSPCTNALGLSSLGTSIVSPPGQVHGTDTSSFVFYSDSEKQQRGVRVGFWKPATAANVAAGRFKAVVSGFRLLSNGAFVPQPAAIDPGKGRPRTAIGFTADRKTVVVVVVNTGTDYRGGPYAADGSTGITLEALADFLREQGVTDALTLDGSGSSQFFYRGATPNVASLPSDMLAPDFPASRRFYRPIPVFLGFKPKQ